MTKPVDKPAVVVAAAADRFAKPEDKLVIEIAPGQTLPFFPAKQDALLGHLLENESFFLQAKSKVKAEWFLDPLCTQIWKWKLEFFETYQRQPSNVEEFKGTLRFIVEDMGMRQKLYGKITNAHIKAKEYGLDVVRNELTLWMRSQLSKAYAELYNSTYNAASSDPHPATKFAEAFRILKEAGPAIEAASFEADPGATFDDIATGGFFVQREVERHNALTFGCILVDKLLNTDCINHSSLFRGDHTVLLAPTNVGKTTAMITIARHNIYRSKSVLFITHEGRPDDVKTKLLQVVTGIRYSQLVDMTTTTEGQRILGIAAKGLSKHLVYLPLNRPGMTIEDVDSSIRRAQEKRISETGRGFDLIIDDYPAKLTTVQASRGHWPKRQIDEMIYNYFTQIGLEFKCHVLTAIQTNREGSKINKGHRGTEERLITLEDVSESWGAMTTATNVISMNRDADAIARNRLTYHICKSRSNDTGWSIVTQTNYGISLTHGVAGREPALPATYYRGIGTMNDQIDTLLQQFPGVSVPTHYYNP